ncbi:MAG: 50S ribosomal protein L32 [Desulfuromonadales bacterium]|nr:50S ribosomal protein L32 [Desulfuromonadales bacterium]
MALPKRRISHSRGARRRTHWKLSAPTLVACPECGSKKLAHHICPSCGYYAGREVITPKTTE